MANFPRQRLEKVVAPDLDVRRNEIADRGQRTAEHDVFSCCFQVVVDDLVRPGAVPAANSLRFDTDGMDIGNVRVDYRRVGAVQTDSALNRLGWKSMDPQTIQCEVMWHVCEISLTRVTEPY